jgi:hypothetical protein
MKAEKDCSNIYTKIHRLSDGVEPICSSRVGLTCNQTNGSLKILTMVNSLWELCVGQCQLYKVYLI